MVTTDRAGGIMKDVLLGLLTFVVCCVGGYLIGYNWECIRRG